MNSQATEPKMPPRPPALKFPYASGARPLPGYTIKCGVGRGGFGDVYYAVSDAGKEVALKLIRRNLEVELRGVIQCLNLKHPHLLALYDVKHDNEENCWVIMEYVSGGSLDETLARSPQGLPPTEVIDWMRGIAAGVGYLHDHGIVHRDLKPGNIFREEGIVKLGDYGLSKFISCSRRSGQTESIGTVHYMAPEVANGRYGKEIDIYALGVILYEMLTGHVPFEGESIGEVLMKHLTAEPDLSRLPEPYRNVVKRALAKDPAVRFSTVEAMVAALPGGATATPVEPPGEPQSVDPASAFMRAEAINSTSVEEPVWRFVRTQYGAVMKAWQQANLEVWQQILIVLLVGFVVLSTLPIWSTVAVIALVLYAGYLIIWSISGGQAPTPPPPRAPDSTLKMGVLSVIIGMWLGFAMMSLRRTDDLWLVDASMSAAVVFAVLAVGRATTPLSLRQALRLRSWKTVLATILAGAWIGAVLLQLRRSDDYWPLDATMGAAAVYGMIILVRALRYAVGSTPNRPEVAAPPDRGINESVLSNWRDRHRPEMSDAEWALMMDRWRQRQHSSPTVMLGTSRERVAALLGSLLLSAILSLLISFVMVLLRGEPMQTEQYTWLAVVSTLGAWGVLVPSALWQGRVGEPIFRRIVMLVVGLALGTVAYFIDVGLWVDLPFDHLVNQMTSNVFSPKSFYDAKGGSPLLYAYLAYFGFLFLLVRWWRFADPLRPSRLSIWPIACALLVAFGLNFLWPFPQPWGLMVAATISLAVQLASPLVTPQPSQPPQGEPSSR